MFRKIFWIASLLLAPLGCSLRYSNVPTFSPMPIYDFENGSAGRFKTSYLADQINAYFNGNSNGPIAIATFVNIDDLYASSTFGRFLSEQLMSELVMRGYNVIELRQADAMQVLYQEGEFSLSREITALKRFQDVAAIVVGTYAVSPSRVYLNARVINPTTSMIISVGSVEMPKTPEIKRLLRGSTFPATLERVPVRQLGYPLVAVPQILGAAPSQPRENPLPKAKLPPADQGS